MNASAKVASKPANVTKTNGNPPLETKEVILAWFEIHWFDSENTRVRSSWGDPFSDFVNATRPLKDEETDDDRQNTPDGLVLRLLDGWQSNKQAYVEVTRPTKEEIDRAHIERRAKLDGWAQSDNDLLLKLAAFVEPIWFPNGKGCEIKAIGNMAYRRGRALPGVAYARKLRGKLGEFLIPCLYMEYTSAKAKFLAHIGENFGKDAGRSKYSGLDEAMLAVRYAEIPEAKEADLVREGMKRGAAQKAWRFAQLNRQHRSVKLAERIMMEQAALDSTGHYTYTPGGFVPFKSLDKEQLKRLLDDKDPFNKEATGKVRCTAKSLESYLQQVMAGGNAERMLNKAELRFFEGAGVDVVAFVAQAVREGNKDVLAAFLSEYGEKINAALAKVIPPIEDLRAEYFADEGEAKDNDEAND